MKNILLQAHRGVSTEFPENTMSAFKAAIMQGYDYIELDPGSTADGKIVTLHDDKINRTARNNDGSEIKEPTKISDLTYSEALEYDYGSWFSIRFRGEKLPLLADALALAKENKVKVKIDSKIERFSPKATEIAYGIIRDYEDTVALTSGSVTRLEFYAKEFPKAELHYDGEVNDEKLARLAQLSDRLTVWLPYECPLTSWVKVPFASEELCKKVKSIAKLGIWIIKDYDSYNDAVKRFEPDIVETTGFIKHEINKGAVCDMHTHSQNSHDSELPIKDSAAAAIERGLTLIAVTDHCDIQYYVSRDMPACIDGSLKEANEEAKNFDGKLIILSGVEIGEATWSDKFTKDILWRHTYDVIIGSVHQVRFDGCWEPYSLIDFSGMPLEAIEGYFDKYLDEMLEMLHTYPCDILAHLTCPIRYIKGKYGIDIDIRKYEDKIERILDCIIKNSIALEINTSGVSGPLADFMPAQWIVEKYRDMGGYLVTVGSDAHVAENVGKDLDKALAMLKDLGFKFCYYYKDRINVQCTL